MCNLYFPWPLSWPPIWNRSSVEKENPEEEAARKEHMKEILSTPLQRRWAKYAIEKLKEIDTGDRLAITTSFRSSDNRYSIIVHLPGTCRVKNTYRPDRHFILQLDLKEKDDDDFVFALYGPSFANENCSLVNFDAVLGRCCAHVQDSLAHIGETKEDREDAAA